MQSGTTELPLPPWQTNPEGAPRRIGVELEMSGLTLEGLTAIVAEHLQLDVSPRGRYQRVLNGDPAGEWMVELDFDLLKKLGRETHDTHELAGELKSSAEGMLAWVAESLVPLELVSPPLPMTRLGEIEMLIALLRDAGAKGTSDSAVNAFGMQFNPEIPSADANVLTCYLKAFLCLYDWLYKRADINITRRLTSYIDPFPGEYVRLVCAPDYWPALPVLINDYLAFSPTRNRALDLLPLFLHLDEERVRRVTLDPLIKDRPAFHYRLPDCEIDRPGWGLRLAWGDWLEVEALAADPERLTACCIAYTKVLAHPLQRWLHDWPMEVETRWLAP